MKTLTNFAEKHNLTIKEITYSFQGVTIKRKGFDLKGDNVLIRLEPKQFPVTSIYARDKYICTVEVVNPCDYFVFYGNISPCIKMINKLNLTF